MLPGAPPPVLAVVVVGTGIALAAQPWGLLARLRLIVPQHISGFCTGVQRAGSGSGGGASQKQQEQSDRKARRSHWEGVLEWRVS